MMRFGENGHPICEVCRKELLTPEDLPRDCSAEIEFKLSRIDFEDWRKAVGAVCNAHRRDARWLFYVAPQLMEWRSQRERDEEMRLNEWNRSMNLLAARNHGRAR